MGTDLIVIRSVLDIAYSQIYMG